MNNECDNVAPHFLKNISPTFGTSSAIIHGNFPNYNTYSQ